MKVTELNEVSTSRIATHIQNRENWAIVSPYRSEYTVSENKGRMSSLKSDVRGLGYGFIQFLSRWVEMDASTNNPVQFDEESLLIPNIKKDEALSLGKKFEQSSVIIKSDGECVEICTNDFTDGDGVTHREGDIVRKFNISGDNFLNVSDAEEIFSGRLAGPSSMPIKGSGKHRPFKLSELYEVESPRASYFSESVRYNSII